MLSSFEIPARDLVHERINQLGVLYYKVLRGSINVLFYTLSQCTTVCL